MNNEDLVPVPIADFLSGSKVPVDLYVRLSDNKYVLLVKSGSQTELNRLRNYADKNIDHFYVKKEEYHSYVSQNLMVAGILLSRQELDAGQKTSLIAKSTSAVFEEFKGVGFDRDSYDHAHQVSDSMIQLVNCKPDLGALINVLNKIPGDIVRHSVAVSIISSMIGQAIGWIKPGTIEKLALGGILHDIGKKELPPDLLRKKRALWTFEEVVQYESHPYRGLIVLQSVPTVPEDIFAMAYEHHENAIGQGFPRKLRDLRMNPLARVTALANAFCELTLKSPDNPEPRPGADAIRYIEQTMGRPFNKEAFQALKHVTEQGKAA